MVVNEGRYSNGVVVWGRVCVAAGRKRRKEMMREREREREEKKREREREGEELNMLVR